ncbi:uncharacterized protein Z520_11765 [Fonsecaea multimorphosa CBS 102226]|uniref:Integral membrane protein n=1 Tax=Fonsecaea multimorphosa CBS 102226 TaxID=1442371 RepID=A0A0D2GSL6_9EURO|nr:uncharacterized protein Z520_11765 [Fonsecaea multimorphosa CBS 102226]KIX92445.1 hypothetical protein Z520_11765 [Fonsecaea multimorphosa CBS 102226]OAL19562.1 hypothetical protein AYO22_09724 [Fonsecaea multimorphosa]
MPISQSPYLPRAIGGFGLMAVGLGVNALFNPRSAIALFQFPHPGARASTNAIEETPEGHLVESVMMLEGARTVALGTALISTAYFGSHKALAVMVWTSTLVAVADGFISRRQIGGGEWAHWGFVPIGVVIGGLLSGFADHLA